MVFPISLNGGEGRVRGKYSVLETTYAIAPAM
jgi:hypothetical protein